MKTAIVYYSKHHENTKKLIDAIAAGNDIIIDVTQTKTADLSSYDVIGFASGIYYSKFHKPVLEFAKQSSDNKKVFFLYTYGAQKEGYTSAIQEAISGKMHNFLASMVALVLTPFDL